MEEVPWSDNEKLRAGLVFPDSQTKRSRRPSSAVPSTGERRPRSRSTLVRGRCWIDAVYG